jgi:hypothetical protein
MKFYNVKLRKSLDVDDDEIEIIMLSNGRPAAKAEVVIDGESQKLFKILSKEEAEKLKK